MSKQAVLVIDTRGFLFDSMTDLNEVLYHLRNAPQADHVFNAELSVYEWHLLDKSKDFRVEFTDVIVKE